MTTKVVDLLSKNKFTIYMRVLDLLMLPGETWCFITKWTFSRYAYFAVCSYVMLLNQWRSSSLGNWRKIFFSQQWLPDLPKLTVHTQQHSQENTLTWRIRIEQTYQVSLTQQAVPTNISTYIRVPHTWTNFSVTLFAFCFHRDDIIR